MLKQITNIWKDWALTNLELSGELWEVWRTKELSLRKGANTICINDTPTLNMSNRSGSFSLQRMGDKAAATGTGGALGVCVDMMYCWGGAYLGSSRYSFGT